AAETAARAADEALAQLKARRAQAIRGADEARARVERLRRQIAEVARDTEQLAQSVAADGALASKRAALEAAQAQATLDAARPALQTLDGMLARLEAEAQTLAKILDKGGAKLWPAVVDQIK